MPVHPARSASELRSSLRQGAYFPTVVQPSQRQLTSLAQFPRRTFVLLSISLFVFVSQLTDEVTLDQRVHSRHNQLESPRSYTLRAAHCPGCDLFLGVHVVSISDPVGHARLTGR